MVKWGETGDELTKVSGYKGFSSLSQVKSEGILSPSQVTLFTQNTRNELPTVAGLPLDTRRGAWSFVRRGLGGCQSRAATPSTSKGASWDGSDMWLGLGMDDGYFDCMINVAERMNFYYITFILV